MSLESADDITYLILYTDSTAIIKNMHAVESDKYHLAVAHFEIIISNI